MIGREKVKLHEGYLVAGAVGGAELVRSTGAVDMCGVTRGKIGPGKNMLVLYSSFNLIQYDS